jgi:hypothetical protein
MGQPRRYSCYEFYATPDKDKSELGGTSFSAPIVAAGAAIDASANGSAAYATRLNKYHSMYTQNICPSGTAELGQVLHAPDLD